MFGLPVDKFCGYFAIREGINRLEGKEAVIRVSWEHQESPVTTIIASVELWNNL